jgi:hypothetical protein
MLRTHLKAFEPAWLDAADRMGMLLSADTPIGEPVEDAEVRADSDFARRCRTAIREQFMRDRSRPSIVMWTLMNEVGLGLSNVVKEELAREHSNFTEVLWRLMNEEGLRRAELIQSDAYADFVGSLWDEAVVADDTRPMVENDFVGLRRELVRSDIRTPHWYGRGTREFMAALDMRLERLAGEDGPVYVTEFGEWGLPPVEAGACGEGAAFWDQEDDLRALVAASAWPGSYEDFVVGTQAYQGWVDRIQGERLRTSNEVRGFCVTEWTDVPHELNGLVSLRRTPKQAAIDGFRPALADVALIAVLDRFAYGAGEPVGCSVLVSNWSSAALPPGPLTVRLGESQEVLDLGPVPAGGVVHAGGKAALAAPARPGRHELVLSVDGAESRYGLWVVEPASARAVAVQGDDLADALAAAGWAVDDGADVLVVGEGDGAADLDLDPTRATVVLAQRGPVAPWGEVTELNPHWGPAPFPFSTGALKSLPDQSVLAAELFHCAPAHFLPDADADAAEVLVGVVVPPPTRAHGAVVARRGAVVACQLRLQRGIAEGNPFDLALLAELVDLALSREGR